jgi:hypothetical protein
MVPCTLFVNERGQGAFLFVPKCSTSLLFVCQEC